MDSGKFKTVRGKSIVNNFLVIQMSPLLQSRRNAEQNKKSDYSDFHFTCKFLYKCMM